MFIRSMFKSSLLERIFQKVSKGDQSWSDIYIIYIIAKEAKRISSMLELAAMESRDRSKAGTVSQKPTHIHMYVSD